MGGWNHASSLGGIIAKEIADSLGGIPSYIADPTTTDELDNIARMTGIPGIERRSVFHALNQRRWRAKPRAIGAGNMRSVTS